MDKIVYTISSYGEDGRAPESIVVASFSEKYIDHSLNNLKFPNYYSKNKRIVEVKSATKQALARINGLDRLLLGISDRTLPMREKQNV